MGLLSGIGNALKGISGIATNTLGGSLLTGGLGMLGSMAKTKYSHDLSRNSYERRYQDTVKDLKKAGLNPILAATGGLSPGSSPSAVPTSGPAAFGSTAADMMQAMSHEKDIGSKMVQRVYQNAESASRKALNYSNTYLNKHLGSKYDSETALNIVKNGLEKVKTMIAERQVDLLGKEITEKQKNIEIKSLKAEIYKTLSNELKPILNHLKDMNQNGDFLIDDIIKYFFSKFTLGGQIYYKGKEIFKSKRKPEGGW